MSAARVMCLLSLVALGACSMQAPSYYRYQSSNGATEQQFMRDRYVCEQEMERSMISANVDQSGDAPDGQPVPQCSVFYVCLSARGYTRMDTKNLSDLNQPGSLAVPQGAAIRCQ